MLLTKAPFASIPFSYQEKEEKIEKQTAQDYPGSSRSGLGGLTLLKRLLDPPLSGFEPWRSITPWSVSQASAVDVPCANNRSYKVDGDDSDEVLSTATGTERARFTPGCVGHTIINPGFATRKRVESRCLCLPQIKEARGWEPIYHLTPEPWLQLLGQWGPL